MLVPVKLKSFTHPRALLLLHDRGILAHATSVTGHYSFNCIHPDTCTMARVLSLHAVTFRSLYADVCRSRTHVHILGAHVVDGHVSDHDMLKHAGVERTSIFLEPVLWMEAHDMILYAGMECTSYFLEPMLWMEASEITQGHTEGKIQCRYVRY